MAQTRAVLSINGMDTPCTMDISLLSHQGHKDSYRIDYGDGLVEMGGIVDVSADTVKSGVIEGTHIVELPFTTIYDFQATAMNVAATPEQVTGEKVFIADTGSGYKIYASANAKSAKTIPVKWSAKGAM